MDRFVRLDIVLAVVALTLAALICAGCATAPAEPTRQEWRGGDLAYLWPPFEDSGDGLPPELEGALREGYGLLRDGYPGRAEAIASELVASLDDPTPAIVLEAQVALMRHDYASVVERLEPLVARGVDSTAARLALGRAYDQTGDLVAAYSTLVSLDRSAASTERVRQAISEMAPRVVVRLVDRIEAAARGSRFDAGRKDLELLRTIAPDESSTHEAARGLAHAEGDEVAELESLRALSLLGDFDFESLRRLGDLELLVGEPASAMRAYEILLEETPGDRELTGALDQAKFQWRLRLLPRPVIELSQLPVLTRGDFAALTYWLVPTVRRGAPLRATIANDVLDHPMRDEIVRVVNLELMDVDPVHRFYPSRPVRSLTVLRTYLEVLARGGAEPCTGPEWARDGGVDEVCAAALRCRLLASAGECAPHAEVSGARAVELGRAALHRLGSP